MCGICGTVGRAVPFELAAMTNAMAHRGPDGSGIKLFDGDLPAGLGHRRLAIIDPSPAGAQPMSYGNRWWITYNGELYNFRELRRRTRASMARDSRRECDTEVLLRMFVVHGAAAMLKRLNGIFAFAIWDERDRRLFLARDRLGVKPLYYTRGSHWFAFASELKALLPLLRQRRAGAKALADFLTFLWVPDPKTAFREIVKLPPGHYALVDRHGVDIRQWWDLSFEPEERSEAEWREEVRAAVDAAVRRQMVSDVPLGSFLSGGIDSSAIVAAMKSTNERVSTWSIGLHRERSRARDRPRRPSLRPRSRLSCFETDYHEQILEPDVLELLPKAIWHLEEPDRRSGSDLDLPHLS